MEDRSLSQRLHLDIPLLFGLVLMCGIGLMVLYSAGGQDVNLIYRQATRMGLAILLMVMVAQISPARLARMSLWLYLLGIGLLALVLLGGEVGKGAQRWLNLGIISFQPSELMKLAVPMVLAWFFADRHLPPSLGRIFYATIIIVIPVLLIAKQPDLGTALLVAMAGLSILFVAGVSWKLIIGFSVTAALSTPVLLPL